MNRKQTPSRHEVLNYQQGRGHKLSTDRRTETPSSVSIRELSSCFRQLGRTCAQMTEERHICTDVTAGLHESSQFEAVLDRLLCGEEEQQLRANCCCCPDPETRARTRSPDDQQHRQNLLLEDSSLSAQLKNFLLSHSVGLRRCCCVRACPG